jgi:prepilin-type N-terminal cleavage/methylation domain-containing protein
MRGMTLAHEAGVAVCMEGRVRGARERKRRGFSLIELLVVIIVIGIIAVIAIPTMSASRFDRRAYDDAGSIMQLFRSARTRAIARGGAMLITLNANGTTDRGTFQMYEAVAPDPGGASGVPGHTPVANCKSPMNWSPLTAVNTSILLVDGVDLNHNMDVQGDIQTQLFIYTSPLANTATKIANGANICYTPLGRSYVALNAAAAGMFDGQVPTISPLEVEVLRTGGGTYRSVVVPPNGMARLFSHVWAT